MKYIIYSAQLLLLKVKETRKALVLLMLLPFIELQAAHAQTPMELASQELRHLFQHISNPHPNVRFFYDLSGHVVDSALFDDNCPDTTYAEWYALYEEMWWMAYDTNAYQKVNVVVSQAHALVATDVIPMGIMDWDYNLLKPDALSTGTYFDFDTVNNVIYDKPGAPNPFTIQSTFAAAPLALTSTFLNPTFSVRPQFIFRDPAKGYHHASGTNTKLRINFTDGTGWHYFEGNITQNYVASYSSQGYKTIITQVVDASLNVLKQSFSRILIVGNTTSFPPDSTIAVTGLTANIYNPPGCTPDAERKYVIYLEGFDIFNDRSAQLVYSQMIVQDNIVNLKNQGYTFVVVNWNDPRADLKDNAQNLKELIEALKCDYRNRNMESHPFIIIGESMGGLIARYTLCDMERPNFRQPCPTGPDLPSHNTRLLITIDAPHQGANIPLAFQYIYQNVSAGALGALALNPLAFHDFSEMFTALNSKAAQQMLIYHIGTDPFPLLPISISPIGEHPAKTQFDQDLRDIGNYPRFCKLVALSNGSWRGIRQLKPYGVNDQRVPNDTLLVFNAETGIRILGIKITGSSIKLDARTNPDGTGHIFKTDMGVAHWKIKLYWFGIKIKWHTTYASVIDKIVTGVKPYCVMPGSILDTEINLGVDSVTTSSKEYGKFLSWFGFSRSTHGNGSLDINMYFGSNFFSQLYLRLSAFSNGTSFAFVPTYSSFDYDAQGQPLDQSLLVDPVPINDILNRTPFDVVFTNPDERENWHHLTIHNPNLGTFNACSANTLATSYLLNREIGDDTLWLENITAAYAGIIEAEKDILINHRNHYYNYNDGTFASNTSLYSANNFPGEFHQERGAIVLSKSRSVEFQQVAGNLRSNDNVWENPAQPATGSYSWTPGSMVNCCIDFVQKPGSFEKPRLKALNEGYMNLYPNPVGDKRLTIKYRLTTNDPAVIYVYNSIGQLVKTWQPKFTDQKQHCYFNVPVRDMQLPKGIYYVLLISGKERYNEKLIIN